MSARNSTVTDEDVLTFPPRFEFGVATAAHQVEGDNRHSDWWAFEQEPGVIADGTKSGIACDHARRFQDDLGLIRALNATAYRFSIEWAKVEPRPGEFDERVLEDTLTRVRACRAADIEPCVTLYHFTLPQWFAARGGWLAPDSVELFLRYVGRVVERLGPLVRHWVTINEPIVYLYHSYLIGKWPPRHTRFDELIRAGRNLVRAHRRAYTLVHASPAWEDKPPQVGIAKHMRIFDPEREGHRGDRLAARIQDYGFNWSFLDSIETGRFHLPFGLDSIDDLGSTQDFLGLNYYSRDRVRFVASAVGQLFGVQSVTAGAPTNDLGWELYAPGLGRLLHALHARYHKPIWITENGIADAADSRRAAFLVQHLAEVARAIADGVPVHGYFHWSLMDNFEWVEGFAPRFGLFSVDYATQERTLRESARLYAELAHSHRLPLSLVEKHRL